MKFFLIKRRFNGEEKLSWRAEANDARYTAPGTLTSEQVANLPKEKFAKTEFVTKDDRPVYSYGNYEEIVDTVEIKGDTLQVSEPKPLVAVQKIKQKWVEV